ncbi:NAD(P)-binding domain-containing protein [Streptomyces sp. ACA25]|uniref:flavin-containing monooxygenase n=1 Tax=Streptomyces sp. ACA25 TaxID=3022596 RepID=UPI0023079A6B|nr:NAD(P)-binding domain-containing protein [Streptomyces sp. ACA25]MDB1088783.1 NAD(P)-binding domain-containing protein [Streptomyces sp. ACA25]
MIGAGPSGLAASKVLASRGIPFDCFEAGSGIGGLWRYGNDNGMSGIYASLHANLSKEGMSFSSLAMPETYPVFPHHSKVLAYLEDYATSFGLRPHLTLGTEVTSVRPLDEGGWEVAHRRRGDAPATEVRTQRYTEVVVANGHHWNPRLPDPAVPGAETFEGPTVHSHGYRSPEPYAGLRVLVIGMGNSACEIAAEISRTAARTFLSARDAAHVFPKMLLGRPADHLVQSPLSGLPRFLKGPATALLLRLTRGAPAQYGLPDPVRGPLAAHPSSSDELLVQLARGAITPKPGVSSFGRDTAAFTDGTREAVDAVVYATGYSLSFPFLDPSVFAAPHGRTELYLRTVPPRLPGLYFMGLAQPAGVAFPLLEPQAEWVADLIAGTAALPSPSDMTRAITREWQRHEKTYVSTYRHGIEIDVRAYRRALRRELRAGRRRARGVVPQPSAVTGPAPAAEAV